MTKQKKINFDEILTQLRDLYSKYEDKGCDIQEIVSSLDTATNALEEANQRIIDFNGV